MPHPLRVLLLIVLVTVAHRVPAGETLKHPARIVPPPPNATVVFNGDNADGFTDVNGNPCPWKVEDGCLLVGGKDVMTKAEFDNAQIHVEFNLPTNDKGHGNSGLYLHHTFEVQILDSSLEKPYATPAQQCGSLYKTYPPLVNACTPSETWQSYDILFQAVKLDDQGKVIRPARITVIHNGVVVQDNRELKEGTGAGKSRKLVENGPLRIQAHGAPVKMRNLWILPIGEVTEQTAEPDRTQPDLKKFAKRVSPGFHDAEHNLCTPPDDARVLFDGSLDSGWIKPPADFLQTTLHERSFFLQRGDLKHEYQFGNDQLHLEWKSENHAPISFRLGNAVSLLTPPDDGRKAEQWRTLDVIWHAPALHPETQQLSSGDITVLLDGIVITNHLKLTPEWAEESTRDQSSNGAQLVLSPGETGTEYRNLWVRPLK